MKVKNNYNECLTNLACSIQKYFGIEPKHNTIEYIDKLLEEKQPKNVIMILYDGLGSKIMKRHLDNNSFFIKNCWKEITSVFPATTTAATTTIRTGLNPIEHGWLGWNVYIKPIDETISLFLKSKKESKKVSNKFLDIQYMLEYKSIAEQINEKENYTAVELFPFGENKYNDIDEMFNIIKQNCNENRKKYIYAYNDEPDHTMHEFGENSEQVDRLIKERNEKTEKFCQNIDDSIIFVIADHGHKEVEPILLNNYPEILKMLERTPSIEQRAVSFKVKQEYKYIFPEKFNELFGNEFKLYGKEEIISSKLFGDGRPHDLFNEALGDFIAIAYDSNKCIISEGDEIFVSHHAGYSDDEIYVPLIIIDRTGK